MRSAVTISTPRWPSSTPAASSAAATGPRSSLGTSVRSTVLIVGSDDPLHELVADDVLAAEADEGDVLDVAEDVADRDQAGALVGRQIDLGDVTSHHHPR